MELNTNQKGAVEKMHRAYANTVAKITITIEDSAEVRGRISVKIDGDYNDYPLALKEGLLTNAQLVALTLVDAMNKLHAATDASGASLTKYVVEKYPHLLQDKAV